MRINDGTKTLMVHKWIRCTIIFYCLITQESWDGLHTNLNFEKFSNYRYGYLTIFHFLFLTRKTIKDDSKINLKTCLRNSIGGKVLHHLVFYQCCQLHSDQLESSYLLQLLCHNIRQAVSNL